MKFPITVKHAGDIITFTGQNMNPVTNSEAYSLSGRNVYQSVLSIIDDGAEVIFNYDTIKAVRVNDERFYRLRNGGVEFSYGEVSGWKWMSSFCNTNVFAMMIGTHGECTVPAGTFLG